MRRNNKTWIWISILSLLVAAMWAFVSAIGVMRKSTISPDVQKAVQPLPDTLDDQLITSLETKK